MKKYLAPALFIAIAGFLASRAGGLPALAQVSDTVGGKLSSDAVLNIITGLSCYAAQIGGLIALAAVVVFGVQMASSRGDATKFSEARKNLTAALIGMAIILGVYTIIATLARAAGSNFSLAPYRCRLTQTQDVRQPDSRTLQVP